MSDALADSSVILDVLTDDPQWADWSQAALNRWGTSGKLYINAVIYAEVSVGFARIEELEAALTGCGLAMLPIPREALFLAGKAFVQYRRRSGARQSPLPDFFIGAHAAVAGLPLVTRDPARVRTCFPRVELVAPLQSITEARSRADRAAASPPPISLGEVASGR